jgi:hypothetical protein
MYRRARQEQVFADSNDPTRGEVFGVDTQDTSIPPEQIDDNRPFTSLGCSWSPTTMSGTRLLIA